MELEVKDRLILYNQYEILKNLNSNNKEKYELNQVILLNGYGEYYEDLLKGMSDDIDIRISEHVENVLHLFRALLNSYNNLSKEEKDKINEEDFAFKGYDSKNEEEYYKYAYFLIYRIGKYKDLASVKGFKIESNSPKIKTYKDLLLKEEEVKYGSIDEFTVDSILQLINQYKDSL